MLKAIKKSYYLEEVKLDQSTSELVSLAQNAAAEAVWGKRLKNELAILPVTECLTHSYQFGTSTNTVVQQLADQLFELVKDLFPDCIKVYAELSQLKANSVIDWHYDRKMKHSVSTRIMLCLLEHPKIIYKFADWRTDVPIRDIKRFGSSRARVRTMQKVSDFLDPQHTILSMSRGKIYKFNNRVPHSTTNGSDFDRPMLVLDLMNKKIAGKIVFGGLSVDDYTPIQQSELSFK